MTICVTVQSLWLWSHKKKPSCCHASELSMVSVFHGPLLYSVVSSHDLRSGRLCADKTQLIVRLACWATHPRFSP